MNRNRQVLVVETDELLRGLLARWLGEAGFTVLERDSRGGAESPRLAIVNIPDPRGAQALLRAFQNTHPKVPVLALSALFRRGLGSSRDVASQLGVRRVLPKPFSRKELLGAVREALEE